MNSSLEFQEISQDKGSETESVSSSIYFNYNLKPRLNIKNSSSFDSKSTSIHQPRTSSNMSHSSDSNSSQFYLRSTNLSTFCDPQPGGVKVGESAHTITNANNQVTLISKINSVVDPYKSKNKSTLGIIFDTFDGDCVANWGNSGAAYAYQAYLRVPSGF